MQAQGPAPTELRIMVTDFLEKIVDYFRFASLVKLIESGGSAGSIAGLAIFATVGLVIALYGRKIHKLVVMGGGAVGGAVAGHFIYGLIPNLAPAWVWMGGLALLGAGLAYGLFHTGLAVLGAAVGGMMGWAVMNGILNQPEKAGYGVAIGIVVGGAGAFVMTKFFVAILSAILGSYLLVAVIMVILHKIAPSTTDNMLKTGSIPFVWMMAIAVVSFWFQYRKLPPVIEPAEKEENSE